MTQRCPLCDSQAILRTSHILPDWCSKLISGGGTPLLLNAGADREKRTPGGLYQHEFLCDCCERRTGIFEDSARGTLVTEISEWAPVTRSGKTIGWKINDPKFDKSKSLRLFALQLLAKAHLSNREEWKNVDLGPHFRAVRGAVLSADPELAETTSVLMSRLLPSEVIPGLEKAISLPVRGKVLGRTAYQFHVAEFGFSVRMDKLAWDKPYRDAELGRGQFVVAIARPPEETHMPLLLQKVLQAQRDENP